MRESLKSQYLGHSDVRTEDLASMFSSGRLGRRGFLQGAMGLGLTLPAAGALLAACSGTDPEAGRRTLTFVGWDFLPDTIQTHLDTWSGVSGGTVELEVLPVTGYPAAIQTRFRGGARPDLFYNFTYLEGQFLENGWVRTLNDLPGAEERIESIFPGARSRFVTADGQIMSLPYFSAVFMNHYNAAMLEQAGFSGPPQTLQEYYDQCAKIKADGLSDSPYESSWLNERIEEYLMATLLGEGIIPFDDSGQPVFADDPKTVDVLEWWRAMFQDGLTSPTILTDDNPELIGGMTQGTFAFYAGHDYWLKIFNDVGGPAAADLRMAPMPGAGQTLLAGEVVQMGPDLEGAALDDAWDLLKFYTGADNEGNFTVPQTWVEAAALAVPYPAFFDDPAIQATYPDYYDLGVIRAEYDRAATPGARALSWYQGFQVKVGERVNDMLAGDATPAETAANMADDAVQLAAS